MARGDSVWPMPPNPQHSHRSVVEYIRHLAIWLRPATPGRERESRGQRRLFAKFESQLSCIVGSGIADEQLVMSTQVIQQIVKDSASTRSYGDDTVARTPFNRFN
eukprot:916251-Amphidinium_carterae.1